MNPVSVLVCSVLSAVLIAYATDFQDLDFEQVDTSGLGTGTGRPHGHTTADKALPGWTLLYGTNVWSDVYVNDQGFPDTDYASVADKVLLPLAEGRFAVFFHRTSTNSPIWRLQQTGLVPSGTDILAYRNSGLNVGVRVNGQVVFPFNPQPFNFSQYITNLVYDVSPFSGQIAMLELFELTGGPPIFPDRPWDTTIDTVQFMQRPILRATQTDGSIELAWPASGGLFVLQQALFKLDEPLTWTPVNTTPTVAGSNDTVVVGITTNSSLFRLSLRCDACQ